MSEERVEGTDEVVSQMTTSPSGGRLFVKITQVVGGKRKNVIQIGHRKSNGQLR
jgi:hypothetical protein